MGQRLAVTTTAALLAVSGALDVRAQQADAAELVGVWAAVTYTAGNYGAYQIWRRFRDDWIPQILIPAIAR